MPPVCRISRGLPDRVLVATILDYAVIKTFDLQRWFTRKRDFLPLLSKRLTHGAVILFGPFPDTGRPEQVVRCTQVNPARAEAIREFVQDSPQASH